jgi:type VI secretion system secreted protein VgrG
MSGGNIEVHCPGTVSVKGAKHEVSGGASMSKSLAEFPRSTGKFDQKFKIQWQASDLPVGNQPYRLKTVDGSVLAEGVTNEHGETSISQSLVPDGVRIEILKKL